MLGFTFGREKRYIVHSYPSEISSLHFLMGIFLKVVFPDAVAAITLITEQVMSKFFKNLFKLTAD